MTTDLRILSEAGRIRSSLVDREPMSWESKPQSTLRIDGVCDVDQGFVRVMSCGNSDEQRLWGEALTLRAAAGVEVFLDGICLNSLTDRQRNWVRHTKISNLAIGSKFVDLLNCFENVEYSLSPLGLSLKERQEAAERALKAVELWEHRFKRPHQMSVEMRFRIALAQAIAKGPRLIVVDGKAMSDPSALNWLERVAAHYRCVVLVLQLEV